MQHSLTDTPTYFPASWFWTPVAMLATATLVVIAILTTPIIVAVTHLSLPRAIKPLRDA